ELNGIGEPVIFLGDGVPPYLDRIRTLIKVPFTVAPPHLNRQRAGAVGALGEIYFAQGKTVSADAHRPEYLRASQAEREKMEKGVPVGEIEKNSEVLRPRNVTVR
ncbi:MAG: tRNA (adenosine(37)-N6)-threonylcarbamoyltransferase complex dimerization subunit type 1 TsaB, partial [Bilifractor sp.]